MAATKPTLLNSVAAAEESRKSDSTTHLDSWKQIGAYLKRGIRTVRRWEHQEGLPVHRHMHGKQATVYAVPNEIDKWLQSRSVTTALTEKVRSQPTRPIMIAVLPLRNLGGELMDERFADGLTEEIILDIGNCCPKQLRVVALTSVMQYKQSTKSVREIGRELGVDYVLEGAIRRYGRRVRLTARLIAASDQAHIWSETYEIQLPPLFSLQQTLARRLAESLSAELKVRPSSTRDKAVLRSAEAHDAYIEGRSFFLPTDEDLKKKLERFNLAIEREPNFARTYAELALVYFPRIYRDFPPIVTLKRMEENSRKGSKLDPNLSRAHAMLAAARLFRSRNWPKANASSRRAIKLNPSDPWGWIVRAAYHLVIGESEKAIQNLEHAHELGPQSLDLGYWLVAFGYFARNYDWAIERGREMLRFNASLGAIHALLGGCYVQKADFPAALNHSDKARELANGSIVAIARLCSTYALAGERGVAESLLEELLGMQEYRYVRSMFLAQASACFGDDQQTMKWLERAYEQRDPLLVFLKADPRFDRLSGLPRFRTLLRRIGLPVDAIRTASARTT